MAAGRATNGTQILGKVLDEERKTVPPECKVGCGPDILTS